jgi:VanZ family protein
MMAAIFYISSIPDIALTEPLAISGHSIGYFALAVLVVRALAGGLPRRIGVRIAAVAMLVTVAYGVSDEFHQSFVPGRVADAYDLLTDAIGALAGTIACWAWGIISSVSGPTRGPSRDEL